jgi:hypothetical protein
VGVAGSRDQSIRYRIWVKQLALDMAVGNGKVSRATAGEESPLLGDEISFGSRNDSTVDEEGNADKANQQVGRRRGVFIVLSLWGLIFLQGMLKLSAV